MFHVLLLEPYRQRKSTEPSGPVNLNFEESAPEKYEIKSIVDENKKQYFVDFKKWIDAHNSWKPKQNLANAQDIVREWK